MKCLYLFVLLALFGCEATEKRFHSREREPNGVISFQDDSTEFNNVDRIVLGGGTASIGGLAELTEAQINKFAGNMLQLKSITGSNLLIMSNQAYKSLSYDQTKTIESYAKIVESPLYLIEQLGGGSARCMIAENFLSQN